jgi:hypothetical protein
MSGLSAERRFDMGTEKLERWRFGPVGERYAERRPSAPFLRGKCRLATSHSWPGLNIPAAANETLTQSGINRGPDGSAVYCQIRSTAFSVGTLPKISPVEGRANK